MSSLIDTVKQYRNQIYSRFMNSGIYDGYKFRSYQLHLDAIKSRLDVAEEKMGHSPITFRIDAVKAKKIDEVANYVGGREDLYRLFVRRRHIEETLLPRLQAKKHWNDMRQFWRYPSLLYLDGFGTGVKKANDLQDTIAKRKIERHNKNLERLEEVRS